MSDIANIKRFLKLEFSGWSKFEVLFFTIAVFIVLIGAYYSGDKILALISAICGIIYTIIAGKGKISCYFFGVIGTLCCAYLSFDLTLYGNFALHFCYYFPMEIVGFLTWQKHLKKTTNEIIKTNLTKKELLIMFLILIVSTLATFKLFIYFGDNYPFIDALITILSMFAMYLTVKRCIEQWATWTVVNFLSIIMWYDVFSKGEGVFSIFFVRILYFILGIYFFIKWKKSIDIVNG